MRRGSESKPGPRFAFRPGFFPCLGTVEKSEPKTVQLLECQKAGMHSGASQDKTHGVVFPHECSSQRPHAPLPIRFRFNANGIPKPTTETFEAYFHYVAILKDDTLAKR